MGKSTVIAAVGRSSRPDAAHAGREAAEQALAQLPPDAPKAALLFASSWFDPGALAPAVRGVLGETPLIGASTAGEICAEGPLSHSCIVVLLASSQMKWSVGYGEDLDRNPRKTGQQLAYSATKNFPGQHRLGFLFFGDGLILRYGEAMRGAQEVLGTGGLLAGAMAGDDMRFTQTHQFFGGKALSKGMVGMLLGGEGSMGVGLDHGFAPISKPRHITRARANLLIELDNKPAAAVYEEYFGKEVVGRIREEGMSRPTLAYPLGIQPDGSGPFLLRNVVSFQEDGSLWCNGEVLEGSWMQLMMGSRTLALEAARRAARQAIQNVPRPACILAFSSFARTRLLGREASALEIAAIRSVAGNHVPLAGFYSYGEQGSLGLSSENSHCSMQSGSVLVVAIGG